MVPSYTIKYEMPLGGDAAELQRTRAAALKQWNDDVARRRMVPDRAPDVELVDDDVPRVRGKVTIIQSWLVWGPVRRSTDAFVPTGSVSTFPEHR